MIESEPTKASRRSASSIDAERPSTLGTCAAAASGPPPPHSAHLVAERLTKSGTSAASAVPSIWFMTVWLSK